MERIILSAQLVVQEEQKSRLENYLYSDRSLFQAPLCAS